MSAPKPAAGERWTRELHGQSYDVIVRKVQAGRVTVSQDLGRGAVLEGDGRMTIDLGRFLKVWKKR